MKFTALEIKQQQFEKSLRGYDPTEVNSFLTQLSSEWEHMVGRIRELESQTDKLHDKLKHYERVEEALHETLQTAKSSAEEKLGNARKEAKNIVAKAEIDSESIVQNAEQQRRHVRRHILQLIDKRDEIVRNIQSYLDNAKAGLEQFNNQDPSLFSLPTEPEPSAYKQPSSLDPHRKEETTSTQETKLPESEKIDDILNDID